MNCDEILEKNGKFLLKIFFFSTYDLLNYFNISKKNSLYIIINSHGAFAMIVAILFAFFLFDSNKAFSPNPLPASIVATYIPYSFSIYYSDK